MQVNTALLSWYSPVRDGPKYSKCLLCNVVHIGVVSRIAGSPPALILQSIPEHMFAQRDMLRHTPPEMASTHLVCPNGPTVDFECVTGVYCLPPPEPVAQDARTRLSPAGTFSFPLDGGSPSTAGGTGGAITTTSLQPQTQDGPSASRQAGPSVAGAQAGPSSLSRAATIEVSTADHDDAKPEKEEVESFGTPYLLLGLPDPRDTPAAQPSASRYASTSRRSATTPTPRNRPRQRVAARHAPRPSTLPPQDTTGKWLDAIAEFLAMSGSSPPSMPTSPEMREAAQRCCATLHRALQEMEAQEDTLYSQLFSRTELYDALERLANVDRGDGKLQASPRAANLLAYFETRFPGFHARMLEPSFNL